MDDKKFMLKSLSIAAIAGLAFMGGMNSADAKDGVVVNGGETYTFTEETLTGYEKTEEVTNPSGATSEANAYTFGGGALLKVLQNATTDMTNVTTITGNNYTNTLTSSTSGNKYTKGNFNKSGHYFLLYFTSFNQ